MEFQCPTCSRLCPLRLSLQSHQRIHRWSYNTQSSLDTKDNHLNHYQQKIKCWQTHKRSVSVTLEFCSKQGDLPDTFHSYPVFVPVPSRLPQICLKIRKLKLFLYGLTIYRFFLLKRLDSIKYTSENWKCAVIGLIFLTACFRPRGGRGGVLDISSGGEVRPSPSYPNPV